MHISSTVDYSKKPNFVRHLRIIFDQASLFSNKFEIKRNVAQIVNRFIAFSGDNLLNLKLLIGSFRKDIVFILRFVKDGWAGIQTTTSILISRHIAYYTMASNMPLLYMQMSELAIERQSNKPIHCLMYYGDYYVFALHTSMSGGTYRIKSIPWATNFYLLSDFLLGAFWNMRLLFGIHTIVVTVIQ